MVQATRLVYAGPVSFLVGGLRLLVGDLDGGMALLQTALEDARRIGSPPYVARTTVALARAHAFRDGPGDAEAARELASSALELATELGMARVAVRAAAVLGPTD